VRSLVAGVFVLVLAVPAAASPVKRLGYCDFPVWSPNARQIAFRSTARANGEPEIWVMNADGSHRHDLGQGNDSPTWSPDGKRVAFTAGVGIGTQTTVVVGRDGSGRHELPGYGEPDWSSLNEISYDGDDGVHAVRPDGTDDHLVAANGTDGRWSPNGRRLAFLLDGEIWRVNADGSGVKQLTSVAPYDVIAFAWAPNGRALALLVGVQPGPGGRHEPFELRTIEANGGHARVLARRRPPAGLRDLAWSPSSRLIAFVSLGRRSDIFEISSRGGAARRVTHTKGTEVEPDWGKSGRIAFSNGTNIYTIAASGRDLRVLTRRK